MTTVNRKDADTIEVIRPGWDDVNLVVIDVTNEYKFDFLQKQKETISEQKAREIAQRDKELAEVDLLLSYFENYPFEEIPEV